MDEIALSNYLDLFESVLDDWADDAIDDDQAYRALESIFYLICGAMGREFCAE